MSDNKNPAEKRPGEKEPGKFHYNPGNQSGKTAEKTLTKPKSDSKTIATAPKAGGKNRPNPVRLLSPICSAHPAVPQTWLAENRLLD